MCKEDTLFVNDVALHMFLSIDDGWVVSGRAVLRAALCITIAEARKEWKNLVARGFSYPLLFVKAHNGCTMLVLNVTDVQRLLQHISNGKGTRLVADTIRTFLQADEHHKLMLEYTRRETQRAESCTLMNLEAIIDASYNRMELSEAICMREYIILNQASIVGTQLLDAVPITFSALAEIAAVCLGKKIGRHILVKLGLVVAAEYRDRHCGCSPQQLVRKFINREILVNGYSLRTDPWLVPFIQALLLKH
jgi:hypothetical protein